MTPPGATGAGICAEAASPPAVFACPQVLKKRADFLKAGRARRQATPGFNLQARRRDETDTVDAAPIRIGFTCSKKVGNAVARNRAKRRLREIARAVLPGHGAPGWDYVLIGRKTVTAERHFEALLADLREALSRIHTAEIDRE